MKKIEIKKEEKKLDEIGIRKIDELYGKKISAKKEIAGKKGIPIKPLRKEDVLKKAPVHAASEKDEDDDSLVENEILDEKIIKTATSKSSKKMERKKVKSVMSDMLPNNGIDESRDEEMVMMTKEELLGRKPLQMDATVVPGNESDVTIKDEALEKESLDNSISDEGVSNDEEEVDEEKAIEAMREEIKNKMKEKKDIEQIDPFTDSNATDKQEKRSFMGMFSFRKKEKEDFLTEAGKEGEVDESIDSITDDKRAMEKKATKDGLIVAFLVFVIMTTVGITAFYFYVQYKRPGMVPNASLNTAEQAKKDADETKRLIGEVIELPDDEEPILATVTDVAKVKNQKFFAKAQNGDRVLIYTINKKAILFRPSTNKIIEVSQVSGLDYDSNSDRATDSQSATNGAKKEEGDISKDTTDNSEALVNVAIYNGSRIKGLAQKISDMITLIPGTAVKEKTNAIGEYEKTIVIDLSGEQDDMVQRIKESVHGEVVDFPEGEKKPDADILVIGGSDFETAQ